MNGGKLILGNWKLNPDTQAEAVALSSGIISASPHEVVLCPPFVYLGLIQTGFSLGAQDCFWKSRGAYTGQVSPASLADLGVSYCLLGHSELRAIGETSQTVQAKAAACLEHGITPVICIGCGLTLEQDEFALMAELATQVEQSLGNLPAEKVVLAYEPVWAIGTGVAASPEHAVSIALFLRNRFHVPRIVYGGSITPANAASFLRPDELSGLLVGSSSLLVDDFNAIIRIAS